MKIASMKRFIKKYYLNGICDSAIWVAKRGTLQAKIMSPCKRLFANITFKHFYGVNGAQMGVVHSDTISKMFNPLAVSCDTFAFGVIRDESGEVRAMKFWNDMECQYMTRSIDAFDPIPNMKNIPPFDTHIRMDSRAVRCFLRNPNISKNKDTIFGVNKTEAGDVEVTINPQINGLHNSSTWRTRLTVGADTLRSPIYFWARGLCEILKANSEFKEPVLSVADRAGLAKVVFPDDEVRAEYYLIKLNVHEGRTGEDDTAQGSIVAITENMPNDTTHPPV